MSSAIAQIVTHGNVEAQATPGEGIHLTVTGTRQRLELAATAGPALVLAVLEVFHPHPHDLLHVDITRWMTVHYTQLVLFPLVAWSQVMLIQREEGGFASLCRAAMFVFGVAYVAFDTAAGIATGVLVRSAYASVSPEAWRSSILALWNHAIVGGSSEAAPALAVIGTMAWLFGTLFAAVAIRRAGHSWRPIAFLVISALGLFVFRTHAWPGGPLTFGSFAVAAALVARENRHLTPSGTKCRAS
ncbi:MAG TPA: hypothetical protein VF456_08005 [Vicinamibacterales bacterium]